MRWNYSSQEFLPKPSGSLAEGWLLDGVSFLAFPLALCAGRVGFANRAAPRQRV